MRESVLQKVLAALAESQARNGKSPATTPPKALNSLEKRAA